MVSRLLRVAAIACLCLGSQARAHVISFDFIAPAGAGNRADGGHSVLQWIDFDPQAIASFELFASRKAYAPFQFPDAGADVAITTAQIPVSHPANVYSWNAGAAPSGCYQPYALVRDPQEGESHRLGIGKITVFATGENVPPSVWITNSDFDAPNANGQLEVKYEVDEPDDTSQLTLRYVHTSDGTRGSIGPPIQLPRGGGTGGVVLDVTVLPNAAYYLYAEVVSADGRSCDAYWPFYFYVSNPYLGASTDAGRHDGGLDAGTEPEEDGGADGGEASDGGDPPVEKPTGCGCHGGSGQALSGLLAMLLSALRGRRPVKARFPSVGTSIRSVRPRP